MRRECGARVRTRGLTPPLACAPLHHPPRCRSMGSTMFDIHHDSPVPIHEQLTGQIRAHIASEALKAGVILKEYRALAQELLANPQVVARAYAELTADGVLKTMPDGGMAVTAQAGVICRLRLQQS